jgi:hypothetical protein
MIKSRKDEIDRACSTHGEMRNAYKISFVKPGGEKSRHGWVNDIKRILKK